MVDVIFSLGRVLVALFLVALNGFFVASEFAFVRVRATSVEQLAAEGKPGAATLEEVMDNLDDYLAATQLGITLASLALGWIGEPAVAALIEPALEPVLSSSLIHLVAFALGFSIITFLHVVFGELAPKTVAISEPERLSCFLAPPMKLSYILFKPGIIVFNGAANAVTRLVGIPPASESDETLKEAEIRRILAQSGEAGHVDTAEVKMIERVFELDDTLVREVMIPRPDVVSVSTDATLPELRGTILDAGHTRYPVVDADDADRVVGFVDAKDVVRAGEEEPESATAGDLARDIIVVPEMTTAIDLLGQFRSESLQMAAVVDEWGSFEGIATVEDVVEAVVGNLRDGFDPARDEPAIRRHGSDAWEADGAVSLTQVNRTLGTEFEGEGYETLGGLVLDHLGRAPETGDTVTVDGYVVEITAVDGARVSTLQISHQESGEDLNED